MKLSILDLVPVLEQADAGTALRQSVLLAQTAEKLGYTRFWVPEHHDMVHVASACPEVLLAHLGAHTNSIRLGSGALLLPHYRPYKVAEAFHLLATLHPGRIDLGLGRAPGGSAHVTMALSGNFLEQIRHVPESIQALTELLADKYRYENEPVHARPLPPVPPELWLLGTNQKSARYAAQYGTGYVFGQFMSDENPEKILDEYRSGFTASELLSQPKTIIAVAVVCAETEADARDSASGAASWFRPGESRAAESGEGTSRAIVGTPDRVRDRLRQMQEAYGNEEFMIVTVLPNYAKRLRSYELLAGIVTANKGGSL